MELPSEVAAAVEQVERSDDAAAALTSLVELRRSIGGWEVDLVRALLAGGGTWADVGAALGTSKQAAWERLRPAIAAAIEADRRRLRAEQADARQRKQHGKRTKRRSTHG